MKKWLAGLGVLIGVAALMLAGAASTAGELVIDSFDSTGRLSFNEITNAASYRVDWASSPSGPWTAFSTAGTALDHIPATGYGSVTSSVPIFYRVVASLPSSTPSKMVLMPSGTNTGPIPASGTANAIDEIVLTKVASTIELQSTANPAPIYRFWSPVFSGHFFTISSAERDHIIATSPDIWQLEGVAWHAYAAPAAGTSPVHRFWSPVYRRHFFTISAAERDHIMATWPDIWHYEGVAWHAYTSGGSGRSPIYRFWSPVYQGHFYTISVGERDHIMATWPDIWTYEGIAYYAHASGLGSVDSSMALIPGGTNAGDDPDFGAYSLTVSSFYMDKYPVTKALWDEVRAWGLNHGYTDLRVGGGKAANHPVHTVRWYDVVKWCNARSEKEGRPAVYMVNGAVYKTGQHNNVVQTSATGYRLPTDTEWEYAARGGLSGRRFPWGDTITHSRANYNSLSSYSYDTSPTQGYHPDSGASPRTMAVGSFAANGYGLYDMTENLWEWCFDWHPSWLGSDRFLRGGSWLHDASRCRVGFRHRHSPTAAADSFGFRTVLPPGQ